MNVLIFFFFFFEEPKTNNMRNQVVTVNGVEFSFLGMGARDHVISNYR